MGTIFLMALTIVNKILKMLLQISIIHLYRNINCIKLTNIVSREYKLCQKKLNIKKKGIYKNGQ